MSRFLADGRIDFEGEFYWYSGLFTAAPPRQSPVPIKFGGMRGPRSFELAGEIADGLSSTARSSRRSAEAGVDPASAAVNEARLGAVDRDAPQSGRT
jgi:5,10-methylenetetrahydromethanopterin reductase